jgi:hypothetical protein
MADSARRCNPQLIENADRRMATRRARSRRSARSRLRLSAEHAAARPTRPTRCRCYPPKSAAGEVIRGLSTEAAAGFQSRRGRWRESTPVNPHYAAFATYKAARVHYAPWWHHGCMAACRARTAGRADALRRRLDQDGRNVGWSDPSSTENSTGIISLKLLGRGELQSERVSQVFRQR